MTSDTYKPCLASKQPSRRNREGPFWIKTTDRRPIKVIHEMSCELAVCNDSRETSDAYIRVERAAKAKENPGIAAIYTHTGG